MRIVGQAYTSHPMQPTLTALGFAALLLAWLAARLWLATRQMRHVAAHRESQV